MSELSTRDFGTRDAGQRPLSGAVAVMGREKQVIIFILFFLCGSFAYSGGGRAKV